VLQLLTTNPDDILVGQPTHQHRSLLKAALELLDEVDPARNAVFVTNNPLIGSGTAWVIINGRLTPVPIPRPEGWRPAAFFAAAQILHLADKIENPNATYQIETQLKPLLKKQASQLLAALKVNEPALVG
jgi:hypothetical protein